MKALLHISHPFGLVLMAFSTILLVPIGVSLIAHDGEALRFAYAAAISAAAGIVLWYLGREHQRELRPRDSFLLVAPSTIALAAIAAVPIKLAVPGLSFTNAFFEAMSGLTATGATVLSGLDHLPPSVNLWRHQLCWIGGFSVLGISMAVLPLVGLGGMQVFRLQPIGPVRDTRLTPRLQQTIRSLWLIYIGLTAGCMLALKLAGMNWFDAICHAMSTLSLGGFSTHDASIAYFHSPLIEGILAVFMLVGGINFMTHFTAWRERGVSAYRQDREAIAFLVLVLGSCVLMAAYLVFSHIYPDLLTALRHASFNVISMATNNGFVSTDYDGWPLAAPLWMLLLACVACSTGSTGGGIKMIRTLILFRQSGREIDALVHPNVVRAMKIGDRVIPERVVQSVLGFIHLYTISVIGLTFLLILSGVDFISAFSAIVATINNTAHGLRAVGPGSTFEGLTDFQTWVCTVSMLLGRLEIFVLLIPFTPSYWRE